jgi:hypothetical protein
MNEHMKREVLAAAKAKSKEVPDERVASGSILLYFLSL